MKASEVISTAKSQIGIYESPANSNNVRYNTWYYGKPVSGSAYPWCAAFISWLFQDEQKLCKKTASCADMLSWFESKKQIVKTPQPGDIVFFKYSTNNRRTNHVGLVIAVNGKTITTIEGNTSMSSQDNGGSVMKRQRSSNIVAYARPAYEQEAKKSVDEIAREVIAGKWSAGIDRKNRISAAGYDYAEIQARVNQILKAK